MTDYDEFDCESEFIYRTPLCVHRCRRPAGHSGDHECILRWSDEEAGDTGDNT